MWYSVVLWLIRCVVLSVFGFVGVGACYACCLGAIV